MLEKLKHYGNKVQTVGFERFLKGAFYRYQKRAFIQLNRKRAFEGTAHHEWDLIPLVKREKALSAKSISYLSIPSQSGDKLIAAAEKICRNIFTLFGKECEYPSPFSWYQDYLLDRKRGLDDTFTNTTFYADIKAAIGVTENIEKDIKVPWEQARFHWAPVLAIAYKKTKKTTYLTVLKKHILSWIESCPFLLGIHWMNPMEVGIRAANWIVAYQYISEELREDETFIKAFVASIYDHKYFLEHNWEWYDGRTNNHYLSNLVGHIFMSWFFGDEKSASKTFKELESEFSWQVFDEGTSYEGSTRYHRFVLELFLHGFAMGELMGLTIETKIKDKLLSMAIFAERSKNIALGDDDSGTLFTSEIATINTLVLKMNAAHTTKISSSFYYPKFGVFFIKKKGWQVSLRHSAYTNTQPSAHFHEDMASVTLSYNDTPICIDPGSFAYSSSADWRNYFRSIRQHNSFYPEKWKSPFSEDLFFMNLENKEGAQEDGCTARHAYFGFPVSRKVIIDGDELCISDSWETYEIMKWSWIFDPGIRIEPQCHNYWMLLKNGKRVLGIETQGVCLQMETAWIAKRYGSKEETMALKGLQLGHSRTAFFRFYPV